MTAPSGAVHPVAEMFPMLAADELAELADDIKANGQVHPIVLDKNGLLIDGRNRLEACKLARVKPTFSVLGDDIDPVSYILSTNISRRHLTTGQRAMAAAKARLFATNTQVVSASVAQVSQSRIAKANTILKYAADLADSVMLGALPLDEAYDEARDRKSTAEGAEAQMAKLRAASPDLADLVAEERLSLSGAITELRQREAEHKAALQREAGRLRELVNGWAQLRSLATHRDRDALLACLVDNDRAVVLEIEAIYLRGTK